VGGKAKKGERRYKRAKKKPFERMKMVTMQNAEKSISGGEMARWCSTWRREGSI